MNQDFYQKLFTKQQNIEAVPSNDKIAEWALQLICLVYPEKAECRSNSVADIQQSFTRLEQQLTHILNATTACYNCNNEEKSITFFKQIPELYRVLETDITAILEGDPAAKSRFEIVRAYPGFYAMCFYRIAHLLVLLDVPLIPRILTEHAHSRTGIDIHPAATIGEYLHIDHGTGTVIGETTIIGNHVKLYQGVTLGALSVEKSMANTERHPTVEDHVIIYSGATILGGNTIIGERSTIGGNVWITKSVAAGSVVYHKSAIRVIAEKL